MPALCSSRSRSPSAASICAMSSATSAGASEPSCLRHAPAVASATSNVSAMRSLRAAIAGLRGAGTIVGRTGARFDVARLVLVLGDEATDPILEPADRLREIANAGAAVARLAGWHGVGGARQAALLELRLQL